jgi:hypothetical protein
VTCHAYNESRKCVAGVIDRKKKITSKKAVWCWNDDVKIVSN